MRQEYLRGQEGQDIHQKLEGVRDDKIVTCDPYGENLARAVLPGSGWTYHHDEINLQIHRIVRQSGMVSQMEIEDYFVRKLHDMSVTPRYSVSAMRKHLKGYVPNGI